MLNDILSQIQKPGRYIGREWNIPRKDFDAAEIKFALCFPDLYEIGMSNLGIRIIYGILNNLESAACERFFSPGIDFETYLRENKIEIFSLETKRKLKDFDMIGFSLGYELCYTNVLNILDLGLIPLKSSLRDQTFPLVVGGGSCVMNPEPMHDFFDLFIIGEAEEAIVELITLYRKFKDKFRSFSIDKQEMLSIFSSIEGIYAPSLYDCRHDSEGVIVEFKPKSAQAPAKIRKRIVKDLDKSYFPSQWLVPFIQIVHDRITLEIMRGCPNKCRFCQARQQYFPLRQKSVKNILESALQAYKLTGYEELALGGLSVSDYSSIEELLKTLVCAFKEKCVGISLPSIKPKNVVGNLSSLIATIKKTSLTFAPEAATDKLRAILGKDFDTAIFFKGIKQAYLSGYQHVKLYFMIGLPFEEISDLDGIVNFSLEVSELRRKVARYPAYVNVSINTLIPKPHTPFQRLRMQDLDEIKYKQDYLKARIAKHKKIRVNFHNRSMSFLEGVLSRGDRRLSEVILRAFYSGAKFDAWEDQFNFEKWLKAFAESNIAPHFYLKERSQNEFLPWDFLDVGIE